MVYNNLTTIIKSIRWTLWRCMRSRRLHRGASRSEQPATKNEALNKSLLKIDTSWGGSHGPKSSLKIDQTLTPRTGRREVWIEAEYALILTTVRLARDKVATLLKLEWAKTTEMSMMLWVVVLGRKRASWSHQTPITLNLSTRMTQGVSHLLESIKSTLQPLINSQIKSYKTISLSSISSKLLGKVDSLEQLKQALLLRTAVSNSTTKTTNWCWRKELLALRDHLGHSTLKSPLRSKLLIDSSRRKVKTIVAVLGLQPRNRHHKHHRSPQNSATISLYRSACLRSRVARGRAVQIARMSALQSLRRAKRPNSSARNFKHTSKMWSAFARSMMLLWKSKWRLAQITSNRSNSVWSRRQSKQSHASRNSSISH